ncbi:MAG: CDC48 family AAA ATPase [Methanothrix sp.]|uniref:AAA family ATPase, CDC48 subfamily n=1 Tax=Methanothrix thermoacetophila (strain DSM 6194 / JCM 14653 / NBRC 101360 / PT) TaxID=349307 RepID=A0B737_METTP|nr:MULTISPECIES: CDC48 family AAA ATPase [Methanothrix]ABK14511.1 AAA family ATPase, CDC48 subfamily [Methanothrix thermoacetophila PT]MBC7079489.1 CDC48 family AAA ATPase [Methanothrix sp.]NPU87463.1 CDC48 family AAA ATPase [Methanothrix sp.]
MSESVRLKVAEADQRDVGKGIARVSDDFMKRMGVRPLDVIEITGDRRTAALVVSAYSADQGLDIIRMDGLIRSNAGSSIGQYVEVRKAEWSEAKHVTLAPVTKGMQIFAPSEVLTKVFQGRPVCKGDIISTTSVRRPPSDTFGRETMFEEIFRGFLGAQAFGLGEIKLRVISTNPSGIVKITDATEIELLPQAVEVSERPVPSVCYEDVGGLKNAITKVREMIELPLKHPELFDRLGIDPPKGILLYGPPGTGKTMLAKAVANESDAYFISVNGPEIMSKYYGESEKALRDIFEEAEKNAPAIIFLDELDSIAPKRGEVTGEVERRVVAQLLSLMDGLKERKNVLVIGSTNRPEALDIALRRPGRFDREIELGVPDFEGRKEIFQIHTRGMPLAEDVNIEEFAELTYGFVGADIAAVCREAAMNALRRILPEIDLDEPTIPKEILDRLVVQRVDFEAALREIQPSALREIMVEVPKVTWDDIGGLEDVKQLLIEAVEWPLRYASNFKRLGINAPKGILLYGPPGTGKTMLAKAVANESDANFITAKGSALLSKWYGESEKRVAEIFRKARQVAPAVIFLDELDALVPVRGGAVGEPHVTERIVNQLLSELDGLEELHGVVVIGATNRPDIVDPALLRPGRFDELILVPVPDKPSRKKIFEVHTRNMPLAPDVDIDALVELTEHYTGADIAAICRKAGRLALRESMSSEHVRERHFLAAIREIGPSVTPDTMKYYVRLAESLRKKASREIERGDMYV